MSVDETKNVLKQIILDHWDEFQRKNPRYGTEYYDGVIEKMLGCGDAENGYVAYRCLHCGELKRVAFSCKSSFCLSCAKVYTDEWVDYIGRNLFCGVRYRHVVLTVPQELRKWFYRHPELLSELMKVGHMFFQDVVSDWLRRSVEVGCVVVLQTSGRSGKYNPHLHILSTSGGISEDGRWKGFGYINFELFHRKWQYYLLEMLKGHVVSEEMEREVGDCYMKYRKGLVAYIEKGEVPTGGKGLAHYLAKYVVSPPISLRRIIRYDGHHVKYWYKAHETGRRVVEEVDVLTFIGRMVQHILPKGFQRIRYYGIHATCRASKVRERFKDILLGEGKEVVGTYRVTGSVYRERMKRSFGIDPLLCPRCGEEMEFEGIWHPKYGWIIDNWDSFFIPDVPKGEGDGGRGQVGSDVRCTESVVQLQMCFV
jgi:hypothetical protein